MDVELLLVGVGLRLCSSGDGLLAVEDGGLEEVKVVVESAAHHLVEEPATLPPSDLRFVHQAATNTVLRLPFAVEYATVSMPLSATAVIFPL